MARRPRKEKTQILRKDYVETCREYHRARKILLEPMLKENPDGVCFGHLYVAWYLMEKRHKKWRESVVIVD